MAPLNILIVGCSIAGPTLATFLLLSNLPASEKPHITILERAPSLRTQGQNIDIRGGGIPIIRKLGLEAVIRASSTGEEGVQWVDAENRVWAAMGVDRSGKVFSPTADIEILRGRLAEICFMRSRQLGRQVQEAGGKGIEYMFGDYLDGLEQHGNQVHVHFAKSGRRESFDVVVGADGLQSTTRSMVWGADGEQERVKRLGMYAAFFSMPVTKTDTNWRQWYHAPGRRGIQLRPDVQNCKTTAFMYVINDKDERLMQVAKRGCEAVQAQKKLMQDYFHNAGWESDRVVAEMSASNDFYYDFLGQVKMDKWSKGRVVLVGDAGYCASPLSGMGTTLALNGAYNLAGCLLQHPTDLEAAFTAYEHSMRDLVVGAQKLVPGAPHIFSAETAWGVWFANAVAGFLTRVVVPIATWGGLLPMLFNRLKPADKAVQLEEYGFRDLEEWNMSDFAGV